MIYNLTPISPICILKNKDIKKHLFKQMYFLNILISLMFQKLYVNIIGKEAVFKFKVYLYESWQIETQETITKQIITKCQQIFFYHSLN